MCTASWFFHADGYHLFFNRDEQRTRTKALPPATFATDSGTALMPIDPDGGGSWMGVNSNGWTFALLNYYQGEVPDGPLTTRGAIVRAALNCITTQQIDALMNTLPLPQYAPFSLLSLAPVSTPAYSKPAHQREQSGDVQLWRWTGRKLQRMAVNRFVTSSSRYFNDALSARTNEAIRTRVLLQRPQPTTDSGSAIQTLVERHRKFHKSHGHLSNGLTGHGTNDRETSVCMHRNDATTVSLSEISATEECIRFVYQNGAPCEAGAVSIHELEPAAATLPRAV